MHAQAQPTSVFEAIAALIAEEERLFAEERARVLLPKAAEKTATEQAARDARSALQRLIDYIDGVNA